MYSDFCTCGVEIKKIKEQKNQKQQKREMSLVDYKWIS